MQSVLSPIQDENYAYFQSQLPKWLNDPLMKDKFVVVHHKQPVKTFDTFSIAIEYAAANLPRSEFIIQKIISEKEIINFISH